MIVIPVREGKPDAPESLRYVLRSLHANAPDHTPVVVGHRPAWYVGEHIPTVQTGDKHGNIGVNLETAAREMEGFWLYSDDTYLLHPATPAVWARPESVEHLLERTPAIPWRKTFKTQRDLLARWGFDVDTLPCSDSHHPMLIDSAILTDLFARVRKGAPHHPLGSFKALYGAGRHTEVGDDPKILQVHRSIPEGATYLSTTVTTFTQGQAGRELRARFPNPSPYER